ncbi:inositol monophosphatase family protein [Parvularcula sp. IMCC14364]|uniref:inositol monophosphatase family protein n=1 Tax=Parvularcula sp. IMCC14364 TaxID=3067902 RepID=UPI002740647A|nr:inositol monophosphatase family protein [Parvularcula sp. IMCC14364]
MDDFDRFIHVAEQAVDAAGALIRAYYLTPVSAERKLAASPIVTEADTRAEQVIRQILREALPDHAVYGEEEGYSAGNSRYEWILDPIDGTIAFSCGKPVFATLMALCRDGKPILGLVDQPVTGQRWLAVAGRPTLLNGSTCVTSHTQDLADSRFSTTAPGMFDNGLERVLAEISDRCWITSYGGDAYAYGLLAAGHIDLIIERGLARHDIAALLPVVTQAGGVLSDLRGDRLDYICPHTEEIFYDAVACGNEKLHDQVIEIIRQHRTD